MSWLYTALACAMVAFTAVILCAGGSNFLLSIPIVWLVGEIMMPKP
jgi:hypothetical protein